MFWLVNFLRSSEPHGPTAKAGHVLVEICVDSVVAARVAAQAGAGRLELCAAAADGGTTPSLGLLEAVLESVGVPVFAMVRPRAGDFLYDDGEYDVMCRDVAGLRHAGAMGIVSGVLCADGTVDQERTRGLVESAGPLPFTFHRAFDEVRDALEALDALLALGVARVLTSGGAPTALAGAATLGALVRAAGERLAVVAGGSVRAAHVRQLVTETGVREVHARPVRVAESRMRHRPPVRVGDGTPMELDGPAVAALVAALADKGRSDTDKGQIRSA